MCGAPSGRQRVETAAGRGIEMIRKIALTIWRIAAGTLLAVSASLCIVANASGGGDNASTVNGDCGCVCAVAI